MISNFDIEIVNNLGTLNSSKGLFSFPKLILDPDFQSNHNLYIFFPNTRRIICYKLLISAANLSCSRGNSQNSRSTFLRFHQALSFDVSLFDVITSNNDVWAAGSKGFLTLRRCFEKNLAQADECMDSSMKDEYPFCGFETVVSASSFQKHNFKDKFFCSKCDLNENSILVCHEDSELSLWKIVLVILSPASQNNLEYIQLLNFPSLYSKENKTPVINNEEKFLKPEVLFCDSKHPMWKNICDSKSRSLSNYVCLIGQPDGTIFYSLCSWICQRKEFKQVTSLNKLYNLEEPILCTSFRENIGKLIRSNLVIIGEKGKLLVVTPEKLCSDADSSQCVNGLWISSWRLPASVQSFIILNDCIVFSSTKGEVWIAKFQVNDSQEDSIGNQCIKVTVRASDFKNISSLSTINNKDGLFIMVSNSGTMYLMKYSDKGSVVSNRSLPILMNGILEQSLLLKDLVSVKHLQSRLFAALSTFANIKFGATDKFQLECKMTEIEESSKKLLITINLDGLQHLNLDTELWMISASIFNHSHADSAIITKCSPLALGQTLQLEVLESNFCPSYSSLFPLFLEVGLILRGPQSYISHDCFRDIAKKLPLYIKTNTAVLTELYLLRNKSKILENPKFRNNMENKSILQEVSNSSERNPLYKMLDHVPDTYIPIFNEYTHCLLESTADELVKFSNKEGGLELSVFQAILDKSSLSINSSHSNHLMCRGQPFSLSVLQRDGKVNIVITTEPLIILGLKTAIAELLLNNQPKSNCEASNCVSIPASILKKCEELSKELRRIYGQDTTFKDFVGNIFKIYCKLRKEVSEKLPL